MVRIRVTSTGLEEAARSLEEIGARVAGDLRSLMGILAQDWASTFQRRILQQEVELPPPHPATLAIRRYYGHQGKPRLFRDGTLVHSIGPLDIGDAHFEVGTPVQYAGVTLHGGTIQGPRGPRTVQPHPFLELDAELLDDTVALIADYLVDGDDALA